MSAPDKPKQEIQLDPTEVLAQKLYIELCGRVYSVSGGEKPQPKMLAQMSFKLAAAFQAANYEFNPTAVAARDAKAKASVNLDNVEIDFSYGKPK